MRTLLFIAFAAAFIGLIISLIALYNASIHKKNTTVLNQL